MAKEKFFKCAFKHCEYPEHKVSEDEAVRINNRYWHKSCYETSQIIEGIVEDYLANFSQTVVISLLRKIINDIVFGKKLLTPNIPKYESDLKAAKYLEFCIQYAINHNLRVTHPQGLYYLIDNSRIKEAWKKQTEAKIQREANIEAQKIDLSESKQTSFTFNNQSNVGFGNLFETTGVD